MDIEYKAKTLAGKWVFGSYIRRIENGRESHWIMPFTSVEAVRINRESLCLFSGRIVGGCKVFENDVIGRISPKLERLGVVTFLLTTGFYIALHKHGRKRTFSHIGNCSDDCYRVIGNVIDTPELWDELPKYGRIL